MEGGEAGGEREGSEGVVVSRADSYESLNRCFTMAFCFACFIEQRADIHVNLALSQSARTGREPSLSSHEQPPFSSSPLSSSSAIPSESLPHHHFS